MSSSPAATAASLLFISVCSCADPPLTVVPENVDWVDAARLPSARSEFGAASFGGSIYVVGGWTDEYVATRTVFRYDATGDAWQQLADFPIEIAELALIVSRDTLFAVGGIRSLTSHPSKMLKAYDPVSDTWMNRPSILDERQRHATVELDGTILLLGGPINEANEHGPRVPGDSVMAYDVATSTWTYRDPMPTPRYGMVAVREDDRIHLIGGFKVSDNAPVNTLETFVPATDSWELLTLDPWASLQPVAALLGNDLHLVGGGVAVPGVAGSATHRIYSMTDQRWLLRGEMWAPIVSARTVVHGGEMYVIGGRFVRKMINRVLVYRPS